MSNVSSPVPPPPSGPVVVDAAPVPFCPDVGAIESGVLTPCFVDVALVTAHVLLLVVAAPFRLMALRKPARAASAAVAAFGGALSSPGATLSASTAAFSSAMAAASLTTRWFRVKVALFLTLCALPVMRSLLLLMVGPEGAATGTSSWGSFALAAGWALALLVLAKESARGGHQAKTTVAAWALSTARAGGADAVNTISGDKFLPIDDYDAYGRVSSSSDDSPGPSSSPVGGTAGSGKAPAGGRRLSLRSSKSSYDSADDALHASTGLASSTDDADAAAQHDDADQAEDGAADDGVGGMDAPEDGTIVVTVPSPGKSNWVLRTFAVNHFLLSSFVLQSWMRQVELGVDGADIDVAISAIQFPVALAAAVLMLWFNDPTPQQRRFGTYAATDTAADSLVADAGGVGLDDDDEGDHDDGGVATDLPVRSAAGVAAAADDDAEEEEEEVTPAMARARARAQQQLVKATDGGKTNPEERSSWLGWLVYSWLDVVFKLGFTRPLETPDLLPLPAELRCGRSDPAFAQAWAAERARNPTQPSLLRAVLAVWGSRILLGGALKLVQDLLIYAQPMVLMALLQYLTATGTVSYGPGFGYVGLLLVLGVMQSMSVNAYFWTMFKVAMGVRGALITEIYRKSFSLSPEARQSRTTGQIVNLMAVDTEKLQGMIPYYHMIWSAPVQLIVGISLLWSLVGAAVLGGLSLTLLTMPFTGVVMKKLMLLAKRLMAVRDRRVKVMNEVLNSIRVIKFFAWEDKFTAAIKRLRDGELAILRQQVVWRAANSFTWGAVPVLVAVTTFSIYVLAGNELTADKVFPSIALLNAIRFPLTMLPMIVNLLTEGRVSLNRIRDFLVESELDPTNVTSRRMRRAYRSHVGDKTLPVDEDYADAAAAAAAADDADAAAASSSLAVPTAAAAAAAAGAAASGGLAPKRPAAPPSVVITRGEFSWETAGRPVLRDISLSFPANKLTVVVGETGSGKSTLLSAILGETHKVSGRVTVRGRVAFCAQGPWIQNATVRDNVLFGGHFDERRYARATKVAQLRPDFDALPSGDMTEIGEKGINLSGGQKQRVALARAVYSDADVYLLDDTLSAVDSHVGKAIFRDCLGPKGVLTTKTRVLVTHQLQFVKHADHVVVMKDGRVEEQGTYAQLMSSGGAFSRDIHAFVDNSSSQTSSAAAGSGLDMASSMDKSSASVGGKQEGGGADGGGEGGEDGKEAAKPAADSGAGKQMTVEERSVGNIGWPAYKSYLQSGSYLLAALAVLSLWTEMGSKMGADYYMGSQAGTGNTSKDPWGFLSIYGTLCIISALVAFAKGYALYLAALKASEKMHESTLQRVLRAPVRFFDTTPIGRVLNRFAKDVAAVDENIARVYMMFMNCIFASLGIFVMIGVVSPFFLPLVLPLAFLYQRVQRYYLASSREVKRLESISKSPIYSQFGETLSGAETIRAYGLERAFTAESMRKVDRSLSAFYVSQGMNRWLATRIEFIGNMVVVGAAMFAVLERPEGEEAGTNAGAAGLSISYAMQLTGVLNWLIRMSTELETEMVAVERLNQYKDLPQEAPRHSGDVDVDPLRGAVATPVPHDWPQKGAIEFRNVVMRYREDLDPVLRKLSLSIQGCESVGCLGRTGAGKSSLMQALFRMVELSSGSIKIDGVDISKVGLADLRSRISIIPQDVVLFTGTVRMNLDPFDEYDDREIWDALDAVGLRDCIESLKSDDDESDSAPDDAAAAKAKENDPFSADDERVGDGRGLNASLIEGGENLSVGQRQLLCMARALLRNSRILVLDEATSATDFATDARIQKTLRTKFSQSTILTIAHRVTNVIGYDKICVLDAGRVVEFDTPRNLLSDPNSHFSGLARAAGVNVSDFLKGGVQAIAGAGVDRDDTLGAGAGAAAAASDDAGAAIAADIHEVLLVDTDDRDDDDRAE